MSETADRGNRYFREIAKRFLARRGAPLFLSAKDLDLIATWEKTGIPLAVVLEGIDRAFASRGRRGSAGGKVLALSFCAADVLRGFERVRDRRVGGDRALPPRPDPHAVVRAAVEPFLAAVPAPLSELGPLFREALAKLEAGNLADEEAEALDARADAIILAAASLAEREAARAAVRKDYRGLPPAEAARAADVRLVKERREKLRVPYLASYYYQ